MQVEKDLEIRDLIQSELTQTHSFSEKSKNTHHIMNPKSFSIIAIFGLLFSLNSGNAATIISSTFNGVTSGAVSTTGMADWGYVSVQGAVNDGLFDNQYNATPFGSVTRPNGANPDQVLTTVSLASTIGAVTLTENDGVTNTISGQGNAGVFSFDGNTAHGSYGSLSPAENNAWTMTFNDLGAGTHIITLYMGHTSDTRSFRMNYSASDGGLTTGSTTSGAISGLGSTLVFGTGKAFTYSIEVEMTTATGDLSLTFDSLSGGSGGALFSGYTVQTIPEPSVALLSSLGLLALLRRRRA
jgi:hypothetical protein